MTTEARSTAEVIRQIDRFFVSRRFSTRGIYQLEVDEWELIVAEIVRLRNVEGEMEQAAMRLAPKQENLALEKQNNLVVGELRPEDDLYDAVAEYRRDHQANSLAPEPGEHENLEMGKQENLKASEPGAKADLYELLVIRGYSQHEAQNICNGPYPEEQAATLLTMTREQLADVLYSAVIQGRESIFDHHRNLPTGTVLNQIAEGIADSLFSKAPAVEPIQCMTCGKDASLHTIRKDQRGQLYARCPALTKAGDL